MVTYFSDSGVITTTYFYHYRNPGTKKILIKELKFKYHLNFSPKFRKLYEQLTTATIKLLPKPEAIGNKLQALIPFLFDQIFKAAINEQHFLGGQITEIEIYDYALISTLLIFIKTFIILRQLFFTHNINSNEDFLFYLHAALYMEQCNEAEVTTLRKQSFIHLNTLFNLQYILLPNDLNDYSDKLDADIVNLVSIIHKNFPQFNFLSIIDLLADIPILMQVIKENNLSHSILCEAAKNVETSFDDERFSYLLTQLEFQRAELNPLIFPERVLNTDPDFITFSEESTIDSPFCFFNTPDLNDNHLDGDNLFNSRLDDKEIDYNYSPLKFF